MPITTYVCKNCNKSKEVLTGSHVTTESSEFNCDCGGIYESVFMPSVLPCEVMGGYEYTHGKKSKLHNHEHKTNWLSDSNISPY